MMKKLTVTLAIAVLLAGLDPAFATDKKADKKTEQDARTQQAQAFAEEGYGYLTTGRYVEAVEVLEKAVTLAPHAACLYYDLGIAHQNLGQYERALSYYDKAISLRKNYTSAILNRATTLAQMNRAKDALAGYDKAAKLEPNAADVHIHRGHFFASQDKHGQAIEEYVIGLKLAPGDGQGHYWLAQSYAKTGKPAEAWAEVHEAQKTGTAVDDEFLKGLTAQLPEPLDTKPAAVRAPGAGPIVTEETFKKAREKYPFPAPQEESKN